MFLPKFQIRKTLVIEISAKMPSANQVAGLVQNKLMKQSHFLHIDTNLQKFYIDLKFFWFGMVKNECDQSGLGVLRLTVSEKRT